MNKFVFILTGYFFIMHCSYGQTTFSKLYWNYPYTTLGQAIAVDSSNFYVTGRGDSYIDGFYYLNNFFLKTDTTGNQLLVKHVIGDDHNLFGNNYASGLEFINDTTLIYAGSFYHYNTLFPPLNQEANGLIYKYNIEGDTIFTKKFIGDGYTQFARLVINQNSLKIFVGGATRDTTFSILGRSYVICLDTAFNMIWEAKEGNGSQVEVGGLLDNFINGRIITGGVIDKGGAVDNIRNGKFYKTDVNGVSYFSKEIGTEGDDSEIEIKVAKNQKSLIVRQYLDTVINEGDYEFVSYIGKMDTNSVFIWRTFLNDAYYKYFYTLRTFDDGSIVAVGAKIIDDTYATHGYIIKLDSNGTILWERDYSEYPTSDHYFYDFRQMPDKSYVISGMGVKEIDGTAQSMCWLVRLDSLGCLDPGCDGTSIIEYPENKSSIFIIYPNPISNISTVEIHIPSDFNIMPGEKLQLNIYDMNGRLVDHYANIPVNNPNEIIRFNIYRKNLANGLYDAQLNYGNIYLGEFKIVVE